MESLDASIIQHRSDVSKKNLSSKVVAVSTLTCQDALGSYGAGNQWPRQLNCHFLPCTSSSHRSRSTHGAGQQKQCSDLPGDVLQNGESPWKLWFWYTTSTRKMRQAITFSIAQQPDWIGTLEEAVRSESSGLESKESSRHMFKAHEASTLLSSSPWLSRSWRQVFTLQFNNRIYFRYYWYQGC